MIYFYMISGFSLGLAFGVILMVLSEKSIKNILMDSLVAQPKRKEKTNRSKHYADIDAGNFLRSKEIRGFESHEDEMIGFQLRNKFYKDGKFFMD